MPVVPVCLVHELAEVFRPDEARCAFIFGRMPCTADLHLCSQVLHECRSNEIYSRRRGGAAGIEASRLMQCLMTELSADAPGSLSSLIIIGTKECQ